MTERATVLTESQFAELVTWSMCEMAAGGGPGKCDPTHCVCGAEGDSVAQKLYGKGYRMHVMYEVT
jgi:hypothetical protein